MLKPDYRSRRTVRIIKINDAANAFNPRCIIATRVRTKYVMLVLSKVSKDRLKGVHPDLVRVIMRALEISPIDFTILEGLRTVERQRKLVDQGASKTMNSRHITGHAVDIAPFLDTDRDGDKEISWAWPHYHALAKVIKQAALDVGVTITWGGDWKSFKDGPHWELDPKKYPFPKPH